MTTAEGLLIVGIIIACEIGFWVILGLGLVVRYIAKKQRLGAIVLALTPVTDLVLLTASAVDLYRGGTATSAHAIAALYLGLSVAFGHKMIRWADIRFSHRFAGGPAPVKLYGWEYAKDCWADVARTALAMAIAAGVLWLLTKIASTGSDITALTDSYGVLVLIFGITVLIAISYTVWPRKRPKAKVG